MSARTMGPHGVAVRLSKTAEKFDLVVMWMNDKWGVYNGPWKDSVDTKEFILEGDTLLELEAFLKGVELVPVMEHDLDSIQMKERITDILHNAACGREWDITRKELMKLVGLTDEG